MFDLSSLPIEASTEDLRSFFLAATDASDPISSIALGKWARSVGYESFNVRDGGSFVRRWRLVSPPLSLASLDARISALEGIVAGFAGSGAGAAAAGPASPNSNLGDCSGMPVSVVQCKGGVGMGKVCWVVGNSVEECNSVIKGYNWGINDDIVIIPLDNSTMPLLDILGRLGDIVEGKQENKETKEKITVKESKENKERKEDAPAGNKLLLTEGNTEGLSTGSILILNISLLTTSLFINHPLQRYVNSSQAQNYTISSGPLTNTSVANAPSYLVLFFQILVFFSSLIPTFTLTTPQQLPTQIAKNCRKLGVKRAPNAREETAGNGGNAEADGEAETDKDDENPRTVKNEAEAKAGNTAAKDNTQPAEEAPKQERAMIGFGKNGKPIFEESTEPPKPKYHMDPPFETGRGSSSDWDDEDDGDDEYWEQRRKAASMFGELEPFQLRPFEEVFAIDHARSEFLRDRPYYSKAEVRRIRDDVRYASTDIWKLIVYTVYYVMEDWYGSDPRYDEDGNRLPEERFDPEDRIIDCTEFDKRVMKDAWETLQDWLENGIGLDDETTIPLEGMEMPDYSDFRDTFHWQTAKHSNLQGYIVDSGRIRNMAASMNGMGAVEKKSTVDEDLDFQRAVMKADRSTLTAYEGMARDILEGYMKHDGKTMTEKEGKQFGERTLSKTRLAWKGRGMDDRDLSLLLIDSRYYDMGILTVHSHMFSASKVRRMNAQIGEISKILPTKS